VLVAADDLPAGTLIIPEQLRWQAWPDDSLAEAYVLDGERPLEDFAGAVVRSSLAAGHPVTDAVVVRPGDRGFLAAVLRPGRRAVTVSVNATTGIAGFVFPGDRVDVILTHALGKRPGGRRHASETVLSDLRVIAVDQKTDDQNGEVRVAKTATLEVSPKEAEMIAMLTDLGRLSLSLRSLARDDPAEASAKTFTLDSEVSALLTRRPVATKSRRVTVLRAGKAEAMRFGREATP
jgi:pilus assembly protein CpaB